MEQRVRTIYIYECRNCKDRYTDPKNTLGSDPTYNKCPFCGRYISTQPPLRIKQIWVAEGYKGWWIFKREIGHWEYL